MTTFCVICRKQTVAATFLYLPHLDLNADVTYLDLASSETERCTEQIKKIAKFKDKISFVSYKALSSGFCT